MFRSVSSGESPLVERGGSGGKNKGKKKTMQGRDSFTSPRADGSGSGRSSESGRKEFKKATSSGVFCGKGLSNYVYRYRARMSLILEGAVGLVTIVMKMSSSRG